MRESKRHFLIFSLANVMWWWWSGNESRVNYYDHQFYYTTTTHTKTPTTITRAGLKMKDCDVMRESESTTDTDPYAINVSFFLFIIISAEIHSSHFIPEPLDHLRYFTLFSFSPRLTTISPPLTTPPVSTPKIYIYVPCENLLLVFLQDIYFSFKVHHHLGFF